MSDELGDTTSPYISKSGYDLGPLPLAERETLARRLSPEERHILLITVRSARSAGRS
jgi:hypothetical protein